jgi:hypothetical protein
MVETMERRRVGGRGAAVWLAATAAGAIVAARSAWTIALAGALLVAAAVVWRRSAPLGIARLDAVPWRRAAAAVGAVAALVVVAKLAGVLVRDDSEAAGDASERYGRGVLPPLPRVPATYAATLADGSEVHAWRTGPRTLHLRVDTSDAPCSGGTWREWWHMADLPALQVADDGAFHGAGGRVERRRAAVHTVAFTVRGVVASGAVRGTLVRADRYRGHVDGVCRRTVRFTATAAARR